MKLSDFQGNNLRHNLEKINHLLMLCSDPDVNTLEQRSERLARLAVLVKNNCGIAYSDDETVKINKITGFFNDLTITEKRMGDSVNLDLDGQIEDIIERRSHSLSSLEVALIFNTVAKKLGVPHLMVYSEKSFFAPYIDPPGHSLHLSNVNNKKGPYKFREAVVQSYLKTVAEFAKLNAELFSQRSEKSKFLYGLAEELSWIVPFRTPYEPALEQSGMSIADLSRVLSKNSSVIQSYLTGERDPSQETEKMLRLYLKMANHEVSAGEEYKFHRMLRGLTSEAVAKAIGKGRSSYTDYERGDGEPDAEVDQRIRVFFGIPYHYHHTPKEYTEARELLGYSKAHVASVLGMNASTYAAYESTTLPRISLAKKLKQVLINPAQKLLD